MYIMLLNVNCSSFSAVAVYTFERSMVKLLRTQRWIVWLTELAFECDRWKSKGYMVITEWKYTVGSALHGTWK